MTLDDLIEQALAMKKDGIDGGSWVTVITLDAEGEEVEDDCGGVAIDSRRPGKVFLLGY